MIDSILRNAVDIPVQGVMSSFLTPHGNIAGQFFGNTRSIYNYEIQGDTVYWQKHYRSDGTWVKPNQNAQKNTMTPSAANKVASVRPVRAKPAGGAANKVTTSTVGNKQSPGSMPAKPTGAGGQKAIAPVPAKPTGARGQKAVIGNRINKPTDQNSTQNSTEKASVNPSVRSKNRTGFSIQKGG